MFEPAQHFGNVDNRVGSAAFAGLLRVAGIAAPRRRHDEPILTEDRKGPLHCHSRDLEPFGQVSHGAHMPSGLDVATQDLLPQDVGRLLGLWPWVVFRDFSAHHAIERTHP